jgi:hypothetical protein
MHSYPGALSGRLRIVKSSCTAIMCGGRRFEKDEERERKTELILAQFSWMMVRELQEGSPVDMSYFCVSERRGEEGRDEDLAGI